MTLVELYGLLLRVGYRHHRPAPGQGWTEEVITFEIVDGAEFFGETEIEPTSENVQAWIKSEKGAERVREAIEKEEEYQAERERDDDLDRTRKERREDWYAQRSR